MGTSRHFFEIEAIRAFLYADGIGPVEREKLVMQRKEIIAEAKFLRKGDGIEPRANM